MKVKIKESRRQTVKAESHSRILTKLGQASVRPEVKVLVQGSVCLEPGTTFYVHSTITLQAGERLISAFVISNNCNIYIAKYLVE